MLFFLFSGDICLFQPPHQAQLSSTSAEERVKCNMVANSWCTSAALLGSSLAPEWRYTAGRPAQCAVSASGPHYPGTFAPNLIKSKKINK